MAELDLKIENRLVDRALRIARDARLWEHFSRILAVVGIDANQDVMDAMLVGAVDAMLFDDATENRSREPWTWGTHDWREGFFRKHWRKIKPQ